jgi:hypothetical protein
LTLSSLRRRALPWQKALAGEAELWRMLQRSRRSLLALGAALGTGSLLSGCTGRTAGPVGRSISVERVETLTNAIELTDLGPTPRRSVRTVGELDAREREAVDAAIEDGYETTDPPAWLLTFLEDTRYVRRDGHYYRLETTVPQTRITAEAVSPGSVDGPVADEDTYSRAAISEGGDAAVLGDAREGGVTLLYVWPDLRAFLERYDAAYYRGDLLEFTVTVEDPGAPYTVTAERATLAAVAGGPVWDATAASGAVREHLREAAATDGAYWFDDSPGGLLERLTANEYVYLDGRFHGATVVESGSLPVTFTASVPSESAFAQLRFAVRNESDSEVGVSSGAPPPFGVLGVTPLGSDRPHRTLWTEAYARSDHVAVRGREVVGVEDIGLSTPVAPGESVERTYTVVGDLSAGAYVVAETLGIVTGDSYRPLPFRVVFRLGED